MADVERSELDDLDEDTQGAFQTGSPAAVFLLRSEQARVGELRERLRTLR